MTDISANNRRIAKNTMMLYIRMIVMLFIQLYTSRVILKELGVTDYGIYNAVGGIVALLSFINSSMSISIQRYLSYSLGKNDLNSLNQIFSMAIIIHGLIAIAVIILAEGLGGWLLTNHMKFPENRMDAVFWVFHFSILACSVRFLQVPYNAMIISLERMQIFAYLSIAEALLSLGIVYILQLTPFDKLKIYSVLVLAVSLLVTIIYGLYCKFRIKNVKFTPVWNWSLFRQLLGFASWSALGEMAWAAALQGVNIVLNIFFGPVANAARGISTQVQGAVSRFVQSFQMAVNPQIIKQYAAENLDSMKSLVFRSTCFSFFLLLFLSLPILLRTEYIIQLWLGQTPEYVVSFCRLVLLGAMADSFSNLLATVAKATGRIRTYQLAVSIILVLNLPLSYLILKMGGNAECVFFVYIFLSVTLLFVRLYLTRQMVNLNIIEYIKSVIYPIIRQSIVAIPVPIVIDRLLPDTFTGFLCVTVVSCLCVAISVYAVGLTESERTIVNNKIVSVLKLR